MSRLCGKRNSKLHLERYSVGLLFSLYEISDVVFVQHFMISDVVFDEICKNFVEEI